MGTEYKVNTSAGIHPILHLENFRDFRSFWKQDKEHGNYFLGRITGSDWPEVMLWMKEGALGITVNGRSGEAWSELKSFIGKLKDVCPDLEITDWDSGDDLSDEFFGS
ncbi:hypothetical protein [Pseudoduganella chitinolytica]|uniref:Uncharacterized protein n=1 Tax=Pseudoduganella chitinolytica TaxID=34070 RepID=A0ABY8BDX0_9BURK|nr:hypothetical protein [Pseudoduganella chitinolytica]WEF33193.1 hypothetical protein PX653_28045 [Pseudoduganella chitinolytica]